MTLLTVSLLGCSNEATTPPNNQILIPSGYGNPTLDTANNSGNADTQGTTTGADTQATNGNPDAGSGGGGPDVGNGGGGGPDVGNGGGTPDTNGGGGTPDVNGGGGQPDSGGGNTQTCVDSDGDGFGQYCPAGPDCDDGNKNFAAVCPDCTKKPAAGCACTGVATNCYEQNPAFIGKGVCQAGVRMCKGGFWSECKGAVEPSPEVCDGKDNDCDAVIDEGVLSSCGTCDMSCTQQTLGPDYGTPFDPGKDSSNGVGVDKKGYIILDKTKVNVDLNHLWVANSPEASVSKVNTDTGKEEGRYKICSNPSRTSVDLNGDVWVGCRGDGGVAKIINKKSNCVDKNKNGKIETSSGPSPLPKGQDECVAFIVYPDGKTIARAAGVDKDNHAWIGFWSSKHLHRLEPKTGKSVAMVNLPCRSYGLVIDQKGIIWIQGAGCGLVRVDPKTKATKLLKPPFSYQAYGINVDMFGKIWFGGGWGSARYDPVTNQWLKVNKSQAGSSSAVATGTDGHTYIVNDGPSTVTKINSVTATVMGKISLGKGRGPHGVAMDFKGYVWAVNLAKGTVSKCDPKTMQLIGEYPVGKNPYTYSDMTGYTLNNFTAPKGHYTHLFGVSTTGGVVAEAKATTVWETIDLELDTPPGSYVKVRYRSADTFAGVDKAIWSKDLGPFPPATFPIDLTKQGKVQAKFLQVEVFLQAAQKTKLSPVLKSLKAKGKQVFVK